MKEQKKKKIIAAGHICLDITPEFPQRGATSLDELLVPGSLIETGPANVHIGGSVSNTGLGLKLMGADVTLMGKIGKDEFGLIVKEQLSEYVTTKHMIESETDCTSYSVVLAPMGFDRMFLHCPGANDTFQESDLDYDEIRKGSLFHFGYPPLMKNMFKNEGEALRVMYEKVRSLGVATSLDTASIDENAPAGQADWEKILRKVLPFVDFFVPSVEELAFMVDRDLYNAWKQKAGGQDVTSFIRLEEVESLADKVLSFGAGIVLIKCGTPGLYLATGNKEKMTSLSSRIDVDLFEWENIRFFEQSYQPDRVLSATGAGDMAIAAFLYAVLSEYSWKECLHYAAAAGTSCVEEYDAISGVKDFDYLKNRIRNGWRKQEISHKK